MDHYINTNATDLARARTVGLQNLQPVPFPVLTVGRQSTHRFFFANNGVLESWSGDSSRELKVTIGNAFAGPTDGYWAVVVGSGSAIILPFDIDASGLEFQLNQDPTVISEGGVSVTQQRPGRFLVAHQQVGVAATLAVSVARLVPDCIADVTVLATGSSSIRQLVSIDIRRNTPATAEIWAQIVSPYAGWSGKIDLNTSPAIELLRQNGIEVDGYIECDSLLTVEVTDTNTGNVEVFFQAPITLRQLNYGNAIPPAPAPTLLPIGPTFDAQANAAGDFTVTPLSLIHTEFVTVSGSASTRNCVLDKSSVTIGGKLVVRFRLPATAGIIINVYDGSTGGALLCAIGTDSSGFTPTARLEFVYDGTAWNRDEETMPAFGQQT